MTEEEFWTQLGHDVDSNGSGDVHQYIRLLYRRRECRIQSWTEIITRDGQQHVVVKWSGKRVIVVVVAVENYVR